MDNKQAVELLKNIYSGTQTNMMQTESETVQDILLLDCEAVQHAIKALEENDKLKLDIAEWKMLLETEKGATEIQEREIRELQEENERLKQELEELKGDK